jgi:hypothetical protein
MKLTRDQGNDRVTKVPMLMRLQYPSVALLGVRALAIGS